MELFEGLSQSNVTAFSSFGAKATPPIIEKQAFIIPQGIQAAADTITEKGITTKFILFALTTGNVLQVPIIISISIYLQYMYLYQSISIYVQYIYTYLYLSIPIYIYLSFSP